MEDKAKKQTGRRGEDIACAYLVSRGHTILERNWRYSHLEVDIITLDSNGLHFVEVKTRRPPLQAMPEDCVNAVKQKRIARAANAYLARKTKEKKIGEVEVWFDIVAVILDGNTTKIDFFPNAYTPLYI